MGIPISNLNSGVQYNTATSLLNSLPQAKEGKMEALTNTVMGNNSAISLADYAALKNGSYKTMVKAYVNKAMEEDEGTSSDGTVTKKKASVQSTPDYQRNATTALSTEKLNQTKAEESAKAAKEAAEADKAKSGYTADGSYANAQTDAAASSFNTTL